ncbi:MAG: elongation factor P [Candidatus Omnitrophota bacterium]
MLSINEITNGIVLRVEGELYLVVDYSHVKPGKGSAFVRVKLKKMKTDLVIERTYRTAERLEDVFMEERRFQYQYNAGDTFHFMDQTTFEEIAVSRDVLGEKVIDYLQDNLELIAVYCDNKLMKIHLPNFIVAQITEAEPGFKGDSSRAGTKPAKIATGATVQVPLFINPGEWVKIDTRTDQYVERVQK